MIFFGRTAILNKVLWDFVKQIAFSSSCPNPKLKKITFGIQIMNIGGTSVKKIGKIEEIEETLKKKKKEQNELKESLQKLDRERKSLLDRSMVTSAVMKLGGWS